MRLIVPRLAVLILVLICCGRRPAMANSEVPLRVQASLDREDLQLGQPFHLRLRAHHAAEQSVLWPDAKALGPAFAELSRAEVRSADKDGFAISELVIELVAFDTAVVEIPPLVVKGVGESRGISTRSLPLVVRGSADPRGLALRPVRKPVDVSVREIPLWLVLAALASFFVSAWFALSIARRKSKRKPDAVAEGGPTRRAAGAEALAKLALLETSGLFEESSTKAAYLNMSEIVREYLGRRFEFSSLDLATSEINTRLQEVSATQEKWRLSLARWLGDSDLVKYAKSVSDSKEARKALSLARELIEQSKLEPSETSQANAQKSSSGAAK